MPVSSGTISKVSSKLGLLVAAADASSIEVASADYICDGVNDEVEVQAAVDASASGGTVFLSGGTFNFSRATAGNTAHVLSARSIRVIGQGSRETTINRTTYLCAFRFEGTRDSTLSLTANATTGGFSLAVPTSTLAADDYLNIRSSLAAPNATNANGKRGEIVRVVSVDSSSALSLYGELEDAYATADSATVQKIHFIDGPEVSKVGFTQPSSLIANDNSKGNVRFIWCRNAKFNDNYASKGEAFGVEFYGCVDWVTNNFSCEDFVNDQAAGYSGYGVVARGPSRDGRVHQLFMRKGRHAFTTGSEVDGMPSHVTISHGQATEMTAPAWDTHGDSRHITFDTCEVHGNRAYGFQVRDAYCKVINPIVNGAVGAGIYLREASSYAQVKGGSVRNIVNSAFLGNPSDANGGGIGIAVGGISLTTINANIDGTVIEDTDDSPILLRSNNNSIRATVRNGWRNAASFRIGLRLINGCNGNFIHLHAEDIPSASGYGIWFDSQTEIDGNTLVELTARNVTNRSNAPSSTTSVFVNVKDYGAKGDSKTVLDGAISSVTNTTTLTSATASFSSADVSKQIMIAGAGASGANLVTTISSVTNTTTAIVAVAASTTVSGALTQFGTDDRAAIVAALTAANGRTIYFPKGIYYVDTTAGALPTTDGLVILGDGWQSSIRFGPENATSTRNCWQVNAGVNVKAMNIRMVGPTGLGAGGSAWGFNMGGTNGSITLRNVNLRLFTFAAFTSGDGTTIDADDKCEIEGRNSATFPSRAFQHDGLTGKLRVHKSFIWNWGQTGQAVHSVTASTGVNLDVSHVEFDSQLGSGQCVYHFDALGTAPTANTQSSISKCTFGSGITAIAIRTPYQGLCKIEGNNHAGTSSLANVSGRVLISGNTVQSSQTTAGVDFIGFTNVATPLVVRPVARIVNNTFTGRGRYAVYVNSDADVTLIANEFLGGDATAPMSSHIRGDAGVAATSRIDIRSGNQFGGQTTNFGVQCGPGVYDIDANRFYGTFGTSAVASQGGTPARLSMHGNDFSQSVATLQLTTVPTLVEARDNYGSKGLPPRTATAANYTILPTDNIIGVTSTASARTITLPAASAVIAGKTFVVKDESGAAATNNITSAAAGADTIDAALTTVVINTNYGFTRLYSNGTNKWFSW